VKKGITTQQAKRMAKVMSQELTKAKGFEVEAILLSPQGKMCGFFGAKSRDGTKAIIFSFQPKPGLGPGQLPGQTKMLNAILAQPDERWLFTGHVDPIEFE